MGGGAAEVLQPDRAKLLQKVVMEEEGFLQLLPWQPIPGGLNTRHLLGRGRHTCSPMCKKDILPS